MLGSEGSMDDFVADLDIFVEIAYRTEPATGVGKISDENRTNQTHSRRVSESDTLWTV